MMMAILKSVLLLVWLGLYFCTTAAFVNFPSPANKANPANVVTNFHLDKINPPVLSHSSAPLQVRTTKLSRRIRPSIDIWGQQLSASASSNPQIDQSPIPQEQRQQTRDENRSSVRQIWGNFAYGANYVHKRHLHLFWEYNFKRTAPWMALTSFFLIASQYASPDVGTMVFDVMKYALTGVLMLSGAIGTMLQLPFRALGILVDYLPKFVIPLLDYAPNKIAFPFVKLMLFLRNEPHRFGQTVLYNALAAFLWRPMMEEVQYRYIFEKLISVRRPRWFSKGNITTTTNETGSAVGIAHPLDLNTTAVAGLLSVPNSATTLLPPNTTSHRMILSTFAFATTRLGWFCAHVDRIDLPILFLQFATSPYCWTVGFIESVTTHLSSLVQSELSPFLQRGLMLLALQQAISTFFVTWFVYSPLYKERGLAASIGAHVVWTVGTMTWPIRLLWKLGMQISRIFKRSKSQSSNVQTSS